MSLNHSDVSAAAFTQMFAALGGILDKAEGHAKTHGLEESVLLGWRLAPDMFTMARQVQIACDISARGLARLAGVEPPSNPDTETSFAELKARVKKAKDFIASLDAAAINASPDGDVTFPVGPETMTMKRSAYLLNFILPNLYFHVTAAYANLRACGVPLGKADYLARPR